MSDPASTSSPRPLSPHTPRRVFDHTRLWCLDPAAFDAATQMLADHERAYRPSCVIGIARGGIRLARRLAELLDVPFTAVTARHNTSDAVYVQASGHVRVAIDAPDLPGPGARLLVADDICGSGATFTAVLARLSDRLRPETVRAVALCRNAGASYSPDTWVWTTCDWVVFPWDAPSDQPTESLAVPADVSTRTLVANGGRR